MEDATDRARRIYCDVMALATHLADPSFGQWCLEADGLTRPVRIEDLRAGLKRALETDDQGRRLCLLLRWLRHARGLDAETDAEVARLRGEISAERRLRRHYHPLPKRAVPAELASRTYESLEAQCEAAVVTWQWSRGWFTLEPFFAHRHQHYATPLEYLATEPQEKTWDHQKLGYDRHGVLRAVHGQKSTLFFEHLPDEILQFGFPPTVARYVLDGGVMIRAEQYGGSVTHFEYAADQLVRTIEDSWSSEGRALAVHEMDYDADGALTEIWWSDCDGAIRRPCWTRPAKGESLDKMLAGLAQRLLPYVQNVLEAFEVADSVFAVALFHEEGDCQLPPGLAIGCESELAELDDPWFAEAYLRFGSDHPLKLDPELGALCRRINQHVAATHAAESAHVFQRVQAVYLDLARALGRAAETLPFPVSADFVTYVYEVGGDSGAESVRTLASAAVVERLAQRGLV